MLLSFGHLTRMGPGLEEITVDDGKLSAGRESDFTFLLLGFCGVKHLMSGSRRV